MNKLTASIIGKIIKDNVPPYKQYEEEVLGNAWINKYGMDSLKKDLVAPFMPSESGSTDVSPTNNLMDKAVNVLSFNNPIAKNAMALIQKYFPKDQWQNAYNVMMGESGGRANAIGDNFPINGEIRPSYGLFQIRTFPDRPAPDQLLDPEQNVKYASQLFAAQGWGPWTAARNLGLY